MTSSNASSSSSSSGIFRMNLISSIFFLCGPSILTFRIIVLVISAASNASNNAFYHVVGLLGFVCLLVHAILELYIDIGMTRTVIHGRYGTNRLFNITNSICFGVATILDIIYTILVLVHWNSGDVSYETQQVYLIIHVVATGLWLVSSVLAFVGRQCCVKQECNDNTANGFFIGACFLLFVAALDLRANPNQFFGPIITVLAIVCWLPTGILYVCSDYSKKKDNAAAAMGGEEQFHNPI